VPVLDYYKAVDIAVGKYGKGKSEEELKDIRQTCYLALLEAGTRVKNIKIAYKICKDSVLRYLYEGDGKLIELESLSDDSVFRKVERTHSQEFDTSDGLDVESIKNVIDKLSDEDRYIVEMTFYFNYTVERIAEFLGRPVIWVKRRKSLALQKLRKLLGVS
jgi:RNA polymerase sigma factor (sigma-70 family)